MDKANTSAAAPPTRHPGMFLAGPNPSGLNSRGAVSNSRRLARWAESWMFLKSKVFSSEQRDASLFPLHTIVGVTFSAAITAIPCTAAVHAHENRERKYTSYPRTRVSLKSLKLLRDERQEITEYIRVFCPAGQPAAVQICSSRFSPAFAGMTIMWDIYGPTPFCKDPSSN